MHGAGAPNLIHSDHTYALSPRRKPKFKTKSFVISLERLPFTAEEVEQGQSIMLPDIKLENCEQNSAGNTELATQHKYALRSNSVDSSRKSDSDQTQIKSEPVDEYFVLEQSSDEDCMDPVSAAYTPHMLPESESTFVSDIYVPVNVKLEGIEVAEDLSDKNSKDWMDYSEPENQSYDVEESEYSFDISCIFCEGSTDGRDHLLSHLGMSSSKTNASQPLCDLMYLLNVEFFRARSQQSSRAVISTLQKLFSQKMVESGLPRSSRLILEQKVVDAISRCDHKRDAEYPPSSPPPCDPQPTVDYPTNEAQPSSLAVSNAAVKPPHAIPGECARKTETTKEATAKNETLSRHCTERNTIIATPHVSPRVPVPKSKLPSPPTTAIPNEHITPTTSKGFPVSKNVQRWLPFTKGVHRLTFNAALREIWRNCEPMWKCSVTNCSEPCQRLFAHFIRHLEEFGYKKRFTYDKKGRKLSPRYRCLICGWCVSCSPRNLVFHLHSSHPRCKIGREAVEVVCDKNPLDLYKRVFTKCFPEQAATIDYEDFMWKGGIFDTYGSLVNEKLKDLQIISGTTDAKSSAEKEPIAKKAKATAKEEKEKEGTNTGSLSLPQKSGAIKNDKSGEAVSTFDARNSSGHSDFPSCKLCPNGSKRKLNLGHILSHMPQSGYGKETTKTFYTCLACGSGQNNLVRFRQHLQQHLWLKSQELDLSKTPKLVRYNWKFKRQFRITSRQMYNPNGKVGMSKKLGKLAEAFFHEVDLVKLARETTSDRKRSDLAGNKMDSGDKTDNYNDETDVKTKIDNSLGETGESWWL